MQLPRDNAVHELVYLNEREKNLKVIRNKLILLTANVPAVAYLRLMCLLRLWLWLR